MLKSTLAATVLIAATLLSPIGGMADDLPAVVVDPAIASMTADQKVEARQLAMKEDGKTLKGARDLTGPDAVAAATLVLQNMTNFPALFADGATNDKSEAAPLIWQEFDKFTDIFKEAQAAATMMRTAAASGDAGTYADSLQALGQVCGECHQMYRKRD